MNAPVLELVHGCNLSCSHCMVGGKENREFLSLAKLKPILEKLHLAGFPMIGVTGAGEITLHPELGAILDAFAHRGLSFDLLTNGTRFRETLFPILSDPAIRKRAVRIGFSLDGPNAAIHDRNRGSGSFAAVLEAVALCRLLTIPVYLKIALRRDNLPFLRDMVLFAANLGVEQVRFISPLPTPRSVSEGTIPDPAEILAARQFVESLETASNGRVFWEGWMCSHLPPLGVCNAFRNFAIDFRGRHLICSVLSCVEGSDEKTVSHHEVVGDLTTQPLRDTIHGHFQRLGKLLNWRVQARDLLRPADFPLCYWCFYQNRKLEWLSQVPDSPWAAGVIRARDHGITPLS